MAGVSFARLVYLTGLLVLGHTPSCQGLSPDATPTLDIRAGTLSSATPWGLGRSRARGGSGLGSSPFSQPGKVVKVPVNETFLKTYGGDYGVYGWDTWRHDKDCFMYRPLVDEEQYWLQGGGVVEVVGGAKVHVKAGDFTALSGGTFYKMTITSPLWLRERQTWEEPPVPKCHSPWYRNSEIVKFKANDTFVKDLGGDSWDVYEHPAGYRELLGPVNDVHVYIEEGRGTLYATGGQAVHYAKGDFLVFPAYLAFVVSVEARDKIKTFSIP